MVYVSVKNRKRFLEGHVCQEVRRVWRKAVEREKQGLKQEPNRDKN